MYSSLVSQIIESPNRNWRTNSYFNPTGAITKITPHHTAGTWPAANIARSFQDPNRQASSNYIIDNDGTIIGCVPEEYRAWTSSSAANDFYAITVEVCNSASGDPWPISDAAWNSLVKLMIDVCRRYKIYPVNFTGDATGNLTAHKYFAATGCPGPYLYGRFPQLATEINKVLEGEQPMTAAEKKYVEGLEKRIASLESAKSTQATEISNLKKADIKITEGYTTADLSLSSRIHTVEDRANIKYATDKDLPSWATKDIAFLMNNKFLKGTDGGNIDLSWIELRVLCIISRVAQKILK